MQFLMYLSGGVFSVQIIYNSLLISQLKKDMISHSRFGRVSMGIFPSEKAQSLQVDVSLNLRVLYSQLGAFALSHIAVA